MKKLLFAIAIVLLSASFVEAQGLKLLAEGSIILTNKASRVAGGKVDTTALTKAIRLRDVVAFNTDRVYSQTVVGNAASLFDSLALSNQTKRTEPMVPLFIYSRIDTTTQSSKDHLRAVRVQAATALVDNYLGGSATSPTIVSAYNTAEEYSLAVGDSMLFTSNGQVMMRTVWVDPGDAAQVRWFTVNTAANDTAEMSYSAGLSIVYQIYGIVK